MPTPPQMFPETAGKNQVGKALQGARPVRMAVKTSPLAAMQWAKPPRPTTKASSQMIMTEPVMEWEPETSQATVAMIHPPMTPDQKMVEAG